MSVVPAPVYLATSVGTTTFTPWVAQGKEDGTWIHVVYFSLDGAIEDNEDKLLTNIESLEEGTDIRFILCIKYRDGVTKPYLVLLHGLLPGLHNEEGYQAIYTWALDTISVQAPVSMQVNAAWISMASSRTEVNKPARCLSFRKADPTQFFRNNQPREDAEDCLSSLLPHAHNAHGSAITV